jgi:hypothetical protein
MNDIDIVKDARDYARRMMEGHAASLVNRLVRELLLARDAIETGRQWETIARRLAEAIESGVGWGCTCPWDKDGNPAGYGGEHYPTCKRGQPLVGAEALAAFRDLAARTPTPTDGG